MKYRLWWNRADGMADIEAGDYLSEVVARSSIPAAKAKLLEQCATEGHRAEIEAGAWEVEEIDE